MTEKIKISKKSKGKYRGEVCPTGISGVHQYEFDSQAGVSQCVYCGKVRYTSRKKKYGWNK